ncbi:hypothetical protein ACP8Y2_11615 [Herpetosiphon llansteffanensis]
MRRFGWMIVLLIMVGCSVNSENSQQPIITESGESVTVFSNYIAIVVPGYELTCLAEPFLSIQTDAGWHRLEDFIMGQHYLDDQLTTSFGMCDDVGCNKIDQDHPVGINLKLYDHVGERQHLLDQTGAIEMLPAYRTVYPNQLVKIDVTYFPDADCTQQQTYTTTIDLAK